MAMQWVPVDSTGIAQIGYDSAKQELGIEFHSGKVYLYFDVSREEHEAFMAAESKGTYLNTVLKSRGYRYIVVKNSQDE